MKQIEKSSGLWERLRQLKIIERLPGDRLPFGALLSRYRAAS